MTTQNNDDVILFTIDYAFKKSMHNETALRGLLSAVLNVDPNDIKSIEYLENETTKTNKFSKQGILDLFIKMSNNKLINIEMQVAPFDYWSNRSLYYITKKYSEQAKSGKDYSDDIILPCISVSIMNFIWNEDEPSFYNFYQIMNPKTASVYSDKLTFHTLELPKLENVTAKDKELPLYKWACLFHSTTWEEYDAIARGDESMEAAVNELKNIHEDEIERLEYLHRQMEILDRNTQAKAAREREERIREGERRIREAKEQIKTSEEKVKASEEKAKASEEKAKASEEKAKASEEKAKASEEKVKASEEKANQYINIFIKDKLESNFSEAHIIEKLVSLFSLSEEEALNRICLLKSEKSS